MILTVSCQSTTSFVGDQYYEGGRYLEAEAAFVGYLESTSIDGAIASRALYRLGVMYATPQSSLHDPERSIAVLEELVSTYPESSYSAEAVLLRDLLLQTGELRQRQLQEQLRLVELEAKLDAYRAEIFVLQKEQGQKEGLIVDLEQRIPPLEAQIEALSEQLAAKEVELEQLDRLKAIDLESPPPKRRR